ncbi:MAG TPA: hypothetical protein VN203_08090 [Candidatus Acidoferrum sp.]|nr:hypothetical protein [Candidatus Acidoferrum sp.]
MEIAINALIGLVSALIGAFLGAWWTRRIERAKAAAESVQTARRACQQLRLLLGAWYDGIQAATDAGQSADDTLHRLEEFHTRLHFQQQVGNEILHLQHEPLCAALLQKTAGFHRQAFETKGALRMALTGGAFMRDYGKHRADALRALRSVFEDFRQELDRVIPLLDEKVKQVSP